MTRLLPSDPRFVSYQLLQLQLCYALNRHCHWNLEHEPVDEAVWRADMPEMVEAIKRDMKLYELVEAG